MDCLTELCSKFVLNLRHKYLSFLQLYSLVQMMKGNLVVISGFQSYNDTSCLEGLSKRLWHRNWVENHRSNWMSEYLEAAVHRAATAPSIFVPTVPPTSHPPQLGIRGWWSSCHPPPPPLMYC